MSTTYRQPAERERPMLSTAEQRALSSIYEQGRWSLDRQHWVWARRVDVPLLSWRSRVLDSLVRRGLAVQTWMPADLVYGRFLKLTEAGRDLARGAS